MYDAQFFIAPNKRLNTTLATAKSVLTRLLALGIPVFTSVYAVATSAGVPDPIVPVAALDNIQADTAYYFQVAIGDLKEPDYHDVAGLQEWFAAGDARDLASIFHEFYGQKWQENLINALFNNPGVQAAIRQAMTGSPVVKS